MYAIFFVYNTFAIWHKTIVKIFSKCMHYCVYITNSVLNKFSLFVLKPVLWNIALVLGC